MKMKWYGSWRSEGISYDLTWYHYSHNINVIMLQKKKLPFIDFENDSTKARYVLRFFSCIAWAPCQLRDFTQIWFTNNSCVPYVRQTVGFITSNRSKVAKRNRFTLVTFGGQWCSSLTLVIFLSHSPLQHLFVSLWQLHKINDKQRLQSF